MKKFVSIMLLSAMAVSIFAGCGNGSAKGSVSGSLSTDGSTSMEKVIGALGEAFEQDNSGVSFTYNPTGSGTGIQAVSEGRSNAQYAAGSQHFRPDRVFSFR